MEDWEGTLSTGKFIIRETNSIVHLEITTSNQMGIMRILKTTVRIKMISKIRYTMIAYSNKGINFIKEAWTKAINNME